MSDPTTTPTTRGVATPHAPLGIEIHQLIDLERLQRIQDRFAQATGLALITVDCQGVPITKPSSFTSFCQIMRTHPERRQRCFACDAHGGLQAAINQDAYIYQCHAGLVDFSVPIMLGKQYLGAILCGQIQPSDGEEKLDRLMPDDQTWQSIPELVEVRDQVKTASYDKIVSAAATLFELTSYLVEHEYLNSLSSSQTQVPTHSDSRVDESILEESRQFPPHPRRRDARALDIETITLALDRNDLPAAVASLRKSIAIFNEDRGQLIGRMRLATIEQEILMIAYDISRSIGEKVSQAVSAHRQNHPSQISRYEVGLYLESLIFTIHDALIADRPRETRRIQDLLNQMEKDLLSLLTAQSAASYLCVSSSYLSKAFRAATGTNYINYVTAKRIEKAQWMLETTDLPIGAIARRLQFQPINYFTRAFKKYTGQTPSQYRIMCKKKG